ncbi:MAG TPA: glycosyltransferase, partial [Acidimicrobiia bacterium]|nr:glycosyltransferase [Acidimicrobiia bacterium]
HQFLPTFAGRDAIGAHCLRAQTLLRAAGLASEIYALDVHDDVRHAARDAREFRPTAETWALYHFSIASPLVDDLCEQDVPLALDYHNVTEPRFFQRWEPLAAERMAAGKRQLADLAGAPRFALSDSTYNDAELVELGYSHTSVAPILIDFRDYEGEGDAALLDARRARRGTEWLAVGRIAPNKCLHDVIAAFAAYRRCYDAEAHLTIVGNIHTAMQYTNALRGLVAELQLGAAVEFAGTVSDAELRAYYQSADVFVILSEHEGFAVPVLEAMWFDVPVLAYAAGALPETVGAGGLVLDTKDPVTVATAAHEIVSQPALRADLGAAGRERVKHFDLAETGPRFVDAVMTGIGER